jgi:hypothetical protein
MSNLRGRFGQAKLSNKVGNQRQPEALQADHRADQDPVGRFLNDLSNFISDNTVVLGDFISKVQFQGYDRMALLNSLMSSGLSNERIMQFVIISAYRGTNYLKFIDQLISADHTLADYFAENMESPVLREILIVRSKNWKSGNPKKFQLCDFSNALPCMAIKARELKMGNTPGSYTPLRAIEFPGALSVPFKQEIMNQYVSWHYQNSQNLRNGSQNEQWRAANADDEVWENNYWGIVSAAMSNSISLGEASRDLVGTHALNLLGNGPPSFETVQKYVEAQKQD